MPNAVRLIGRMAIKCLALFVPTFRMRYIWRMFVLVLSTSVIVVLITTFKYQNQANTQSSCPDLQPSKASHLGSSKELPPSKTPVVSVINPHPFHYLQNPRNACRTDQGHHVHVLVYVHSAAAHNDKRMVIRRTWGTTDLLQSYNATLVFVLGKVPELSIMDQVEKESHVFNDIVQEDFLDTYHNLTYKAVAALKWASTFCSQVTYILKTDDDVEVNTGAVMKFLHNKAQPQRRLMMCNLWTGRKPHRHNTSRWYVSEEQYKGTSYPNFCLGVAYIMTGDLPPLLYRASLSMPFMWVDDVYITGIVAQCVGAHHQSINHVYSYKPRNMTGMQFFSH